MKKAPAQGAFFFAMQIASEVVDRLQAGAHFQDVVFGVVLFPVDVHAEQPATFVERERAAGNLDAGVDILDLKEIVQVVAEGLFDERGRTSR